MNFIYPWIFGVFLHTSMKATLLILQEAKLDILCINLSAFTYCVTLSLKLYNFQD